ncbi:hypothetical protein G6F68_015491 [Rhizopus microsporus]|nr:hypothetical protein G6F68_015491 [Rhizopus microsporus]
MAAGCTGTGRGRYQPMVLVAGTPEAGRAGQPVTVPVVADRAALRQCGLVAGGRRAGRRAAAGRVACLVDHVRTGAGLQWRAPVRLEAAGVAGAACGAGSRRVDRQRAATARTLRAYGDGLGGRRTRCRPGAVRACTDLAGRRVHD